MSENLIKIRLKGNERIWAEDLGNNTAKIKNVPFNIEYGLNDVVSFDPISGDVKEILEKKTITIPIGYEPETDKDKMKTKWKTIHDHFENKGIKIEGFMAGIAGLSVPADMSDEIIEEVFSSCPEKVFILEH